MRVSELIEKLQRLDPDAQVVVPNNDGLREWSLIDVKNLGVFASSRRVGMVFDHEFTGDDE